MINIIVIVIAVIAILSAVLIPTFGGIVDKANNSADLQEAKNMYTAYLIDTNAQSEGSVVVKLGTSEKVRYVVFTNGQPVLENEEVANDYVQENIPTSISTYVLVEVATDTSDADGITYSNVPAADEGAED